MLCEQGRLTESLLPFLWRGTALHPKDYQAATRMLCDAGVLIDLLPGDFEESGAGEAQWVMPMRLSPERPSTVDAKLWPPTTLEAGKAQLGARFDFLSAGVPAGLFELCAAAAATRGTMILIWNGGLVLNTNGGVRVLLQLTHSAAGTALEVEVRGVGAALWAVLAPLVCEVRRVLDSFSGLQVDELLVCPRCRAEGRWDAPSTWPLPDASEALTSKLCKRSGDTVDLLAFAGAGGAAAAVGTPVAVPAAIAVGTAVQGTAVQATDSTEPKAAAAFNPSALLLRQA